MSLRIVTIGVFAGIDTTVSGVCPLTSANHSPTGPNAHEIGQVLGSVVDLAGGNDITQQFVLIQDWTDTTEKVPTYGILQKSGFNNSGKQLLVTTMAP